MRMIPVAKWPEGKGLSLLLGLAAFFGALVGFMLGTLTCKLVI